MKTFKQFITEIRDKFDPHEPIIRKLASLGRMDHMRANIHDHENNSLNHRSVYGDCDSISHCVANRLRHTYPSVKVVYSHNFGHPLPEDPDGSEGLTGHSWVEIPETGHFVDASHDMFRIKGNREQIPMKGMSFPQSAVKIGKRNSTEYRKNYGGIHRKKQTDRNWIPGKKLNENASEDLHHDLWSKIEHHDRNASEDIKPHLDNWFGHSYEELDKYGHGSGIMMPHKAEQHHEEIHKTGEPIRNILKQHFGDYITVYRGEHPNGKPTTGRTNTLHSWTLDPKVAVRFALPSGTPNYRLKSISDEEIAHHQNEYNKTGTTTLKNGRTYKQSEFGGVDMFDKHGNHITDTTSVTDDLKQKQSEANEHNNNLDKIHKEASKYVKSKIVHINDVVWASNRANQKELIIRNKHENI